MLPIDDGRYFRATLDAAHAATIFHDIATRFARTSLAPRPGHFQHEMPALADMGCTIPQQLGIAADSAGARLACAHDSQYSISRDYSARRRPLLCRHAAISLLA